MTEELKLQFYALLQKKRAYNEETISRPQYSAAIKEFENKTGYSKAYIHEILRELEENNLKAPSVPVTEGSELHTLVASLLGSNLGYPEEDMPVTFEGKQFAVPKYELKGIVMALRNIYNRCNFPDASKFQVNHYELREYYLHHLIEDQVHAMRQVRSPDALYKLCLSARALQNGSLRPHPNRETLDNILHELKPEITDMEIDKLIDKHHPQD